MSYGKITQIGPDPNGGMMGNLTDIETTKTYTFAKQMNIPDVNNKDVVNFTANGGEATDLTPNISIRTTGLNKASQDVQTAFLTLICAMAKDGNDTDIIARKVK